MVSASVALLRPEAHTWFRVSVVSEKGSPAGTVGLAGWDLADTGLHHDAEDGVL